jgi:hypothetical protein
MKRSFVVFLLVNLMLRLLTAIHYLEAIFIIVE